MRIEAFLQHSPLFAIQRASRQFEKHLAHVFPGERLSFLEALILVSIFLEEPQLIQPSELAETLVMSRGNVSHSISSLEARGMVRRRIHADDARAIQILLRPDGKSYAIRAIRILDRLQRDFERQLGVSQLQSALKAINEVERLCTARGALR